jgi:hypothetical protein
MKRTACALAQLAIGRHSAAHQQQYANVRIGSVDVSMFRHDDPIDVIEQEIAAKRRALDWIMYQPPSQPYASQPLRNSARMNCGALSLPLAVRFGASQSKLPLAR